MKRFLVYIALGLLCVGAYIVNAGIDTDTYKLNGDVSFSTNGAVDVNGVVVQTNLVPAASNVHSLGSAVAPWKDLYISTGTIHMGSIRIEGDMEGNISVNGAQLATTNYVATNSSSAVTNGLASIAYVDSVTGAVDVITNGLASIGYVDGATSSVGLAQVLTFSPDAGGLSPSNVASLFDSTGILAVDLLNGSLKSNDVPVLNWAYSANGMIGGVLIPSLYAMDIWNDTGNRVWQINGMGTSSNMLFDGNLGVPVVDLLNFNLISNEVSVLNWGYAANGMPGGVYIPSLYLLDIWTDNGMRAWQLSSDSNMLFETQNGTASVDANGRNLISNDVSVLNWGYAANGMPGGTYSPNLYVQDVWSYDGWKVWQASSASNMLFCPQDNTPAVDAFTRKLVSNDVVTLEWYVTTNSLPIGVYTPVHYAPSLYAMDVWTIDGGAYKWQIGGDSNTLFSWDNGGNVAYPSVNAQNRILYAVDGITPAINWSDNTGVTGIWFNAAITCPSGIVSTLGEEVCINTDYRQLKDDNVSTLSLDWNTRSLYAVDGVTPVMNWSDNGAVSGVVFNVGISCISGIVQSTASGEISINTEARQLCDDNVATVSLDWSKRVLYATDGTTTNLDWSDKILTNGVWKVDGGATAGKEIVNFQTMTNYVAQPSNSVALASDQAVYLGDKDTDGTWRMTRSGDNLVFQRRESGNYVTKGSYTP